MYKYREKKFILKTNMVEFIADYYSSIGKGLSDDEYNELSNIYGPKPIDKNLEKELIGEFIDFDIYRTKDGSWLIRRVA